MYDTPFLLEKEPGNKYKNRDEVERSMDNSTQIPFLRSPYEPMDLAKTHTAGFGMKSTGGSYFSSQRNSSVKQREKARRIRQ